MVNGFIVVEYNMFVFSYFFFAELLVLVGSIQHCVCVLTVLCVLFFVLKYRLLFFVCRRFVLLNNNNNSIYIISKLFQSTVWIISLTTQLFTSIHRSKMYIILFLAQKKVWYIFNIFSLSSSVKFMLEFGPTVYGDATKFL